MNRLLTLPPKPKVGQPCPLRRYHEHDDDFRSVLSDLAQHWEGSGAQMAIHLPNRTLRTGTDFGILLEQAPNALYDLEDGRPTALSMYEQTAMLDIDMVPLFDSTKTRLTGRPWSNTPPCSWEVESNVVLQDLRDGIRLVQAWVDASQNPLAGEWVKDWYDPHAARS